MNINVTVTHTVSPELMGLLEKLIGGNTAAATTGKKKTPVVEMKQPGEEITKSELAATLPGRPAEEEKPTAQTSSVSTETELTLEEIRAEATRIAKLSDNHKVKVKELVNSFGVDKLPALPKEKYADYYSELQKIA